MAVVVHGGAPLDAPLDARPGVGKIFVMLHGGQPISIIEFIQKSDGSRAVGMTTQFGHGLSRSAPDGSSWALSGDGCWLIMSFRYKDDTAFLHQVKFKWNRDHEVWESILLGRKICLLPPNDRYLDFVALAQMVIDPFNHEADLAWTSLRSRS